MRGLGVWYGSDQEYFCRCVRFGQLIFFLGITVRELAIFDVSKGGSALVWYWVLSMREGGFLLVVI